MFKSALQGAHRLPLIQRLSRSQCLLPVQACSASAHLQKRFATGFGGSSYYDSKLVGPPELYTEVEKSYAEWKFVEKLIPPDYVPTPPTDPHVEYPSGWKPPNPPRQTQYIVRRTKNHMLPVYLKIDPRHLGSRRITRIRYVEGNIWALEKDVGEFLKWKFPDKQIVTWVHEPWRQVNVLGEHDELVKGWLLEQGF